MNTNPTMVCLIDELTRCGMHIDIFVPKGGEFPESNRGITVFRFPQRFRLWLGDIKSTLRNWKSFLYSFSARGYGLFANKPYDLIVGTDANGVVAAYNQAKGTGTPFVYLSFEIFFRDELIKREDILMKEEEVIASKKAKMIIIQDPWRADLLCRENQLVDKKIVYLPVSARSSYSVQGSNYIRKRFNIPEWKTIVLHSGTFADWTYGEELVANFSLWPKDMAFVIHVRRDNLQGDRYIERIKQQELDNVFLSTERLAEYEHEEMVSSADVGLLLYKTSNKSKYEGKNLEYIGLSSGKFSFYMKYGLPVVAVNSPTYDKYLENYGFGFNVEKFESIPSAIDRIRNNYDFHRCEAKRLFAEVLDFDKCWPPVLNGVKEIIRFS